MYSAMMYLTSLTLLVVILSIQFHLYVQAGLILIPAAGPIPIPAAAGGPKAWPVGAVDPVKKDTLQRAEGATAKYIAKRTTATGDDDFSTHIDDAAIGSASATDSDNNVENAAADIHGAGAGILPIPRPPPPTKPRCSDFQAVAQERCADKDVGPQAKPDATIEAMEPTKKDVIERAEDATTIFLPKRATEAETIAVITTEERGLEGDAAAGTLPEPCPRSTSMLFSLCAPKTGWSVYDFL
ncbi:hypothetical protein BGX30_005441 [Mortierella sp. GBA39]|nr:hypothetical protein BGX30_005441 [Mortierella sp. GBA39]